MQIEDLANRTDIDDEEKKRRKHKLEEEIAAGVVGGGILGYAGYRRRRHSVAPGSQFFEVTIYWKYFFIPFFLVDL